MVVVGGDMQQPEQSDSTHVGTNICGLVSSLCIIWSAFRLKDVAEHAANLLPGQAQDLSLFLATAC